MTEREREKWKASVAESAAIVGVDIKTAERLMSADEVLEKLPERFIEVVDDLGKARAYIAKLEREKVALLRERENLLSFIKGVSRQMAECYKAHET